MGSDDDGEMMLVLVGDEGYDTFDMLTSSYFLACRLDRDTTSSEATHLPETHSCHPVLDASSGTQLFFIGT